MRDRWAPGGLSGTQPNEEKKAPKLCPGLASSREPRRLEYAEPKQRPPITRSNFRVAEWAGEVKASSKR